MTIKRPRDTQLRCDDCGHTTPVTTKGMAERALRIHSCATVKERAARTQRRLDRENADGPTRPCLHKEANHTHGHYATYTLDRCRCRPCRDAASQYEANRVRAHLYGRWNGYVDATASREHVRSLMDQGMGLKRIVAVSGVPQGTLWKLMYGKLRADGTRTPSRRVTPDTERRLLATRLDLAGGAVIDPTGTARRVQALVARGWSMSKIASRIGVTPANFTPIAYGTRRVTTATAKAVSDLYEQLWNQLPPRDGHRDKIAYSRALSHAARLRWAPPLAWDDDTIDDPTATPDLGEPVKTTGGKRIHLEDVEFLIDQGLTRDQVAHRLRVSKSALEYACTRNDRRDLLKRMDRNAVAQENAA